MIIFRKSNYHLFRPCQKTVSSFGIGLLSLLIFIGTQFVLANPSTNLDLGKIDIYQTPVSGTVTDEDGTPLPGASVLVKGSTNGTQTDFDGKFTIDTDSNAILVISYIGFIKQEVAVSGKSTIAVILLEDTSKLDEVVVVGYGSQKKEAVTGAVSTISSDVITATPVPSFTEAMQGRLPGVVVTNNGGPGVDPIVRIRGIGSISFASNPLYVVDGYPVGGLNDFDNNDIESISVLKDASSTAIYGSRASNGVVLVSTKKGRSNQKLEVDYTGYTGYAYETNRLDLLNRDQYLQYGRMLLGNANVAFPSRWSNLDTPIYAGATQTYAETETDYQDAVFQSGLTMNHYLSLKGGGENSRYFSSFGYYKQEGIMIGTNYERYNLRLNSEHTVHEKVKIGETLTLVSGERNNQAEAGGRTQIQNIIRGVPYIPIYDPTLPGGYRAPDAADGSDPENPVRAAIMDSNDNYNTRIMGTGYIAAELLEGLEYRFTAGVDWNYARNLIINPIYFDGFKGNDTKDINENRSTYFGTYFSNQITYKNSWGDHNFDVIGVAERQDGRYSNVQGQGERNSNTLNVLSGSQNQQVNGGEGENTLYSYIGRLNYDFAGRYLLSASLRRDGSSKFAEGHKWATFPGISAGWNLAKESFMEGFENLSELKIRGSWGKVGFEGIGDYESQAGISNNTTAILDDSPLQGAYFNRLANSELEWEITTMTNVGLDLGFYSNRLQFSAEWYERSTDNLILSVPLPASMGYASSTIANIGSMENWGLEFQGSYFSNPVNEFKWNVTANLSLYRNNVVALSTDSATIYAGANGDAGNFDITRTTAGDPIQSFYGWKVAGIFQNQAEIDEYNSKSPNGYYQTDVTAPGDLIFEDLNNDGTITPDDRTVLGSFIPEFNYGVNFDAEYKNIFFTMFWTGVQGNEIYNAAKIFMEGGLRLFGAGTQTLNAWTPQNTNTNIPRMVNGDPNNNTRTSDRFLEDGSYLRLQNVKLGYRLPSDWLDRQTKGAVRKVEVYLSGSNLLTFTKYTGYDPEIGSRNNNLNTVGIDYGQFPQPTTVLFGLQVGF